VFTDADTEFTFASVPATVTFADLYRGVELRPEPLPFRTKKKFPFPKSGWGVRVRPLFHSHSQQNI
jgi:hypothetical protein